MTILIKTCAYTTDNFIKSLKVPKITLGIMINASDILNYEEGYISALKKLLNNKKNLKLNLLDLLHLYEVEHLDKVCKFIKKLDYKLFINVMQLLVHQIKK